MVEEWMAEETPAQQTTPAQSDKDGIKNMLLSTPLGYRLNLARKTGAYRPRGNPTIQPASGPLTSTAIWQQAEREVEALGLPKHVDPPKNWDSLIALQWMLQTQAKDSTILDAGAEVYSVILPWLYMYGYKNLMGINLTFDQPVHRGRIQYEHGDITATRFADASFGAITCLSVIEHGVPLDGYFKESARLLKPGGMLITSFDYFPQPIDTSGMVAYGVPVKIFSAQDVQSMLQVASGYGLDPVGPVATECQERPVHWTQNDLDYTFFTLGLRKRA
jgi:SAM-dependent methyltransferase